MITPERRGNPEPLPKLMFESEVRAALRLLSDQSLSGILSLDQEFKGTSVRDILKDKHPCTIGTPQHSPAIISMYH